MCSPRRFALLPFSNLSPILGIKSSKFDLLHEFVENSSCVLKETLGY